MVTVAHGVFTDYCEAALAYAVYTPMEDGRWFAEIPVCDGVWGEGQTRAEAAAELRSALEGWILLGLQLGHPLPVIDGFDLTSRPPDETP